ncbi:hypothetical protein FB45DRAFT_945660 [Roridomyces roridus]|uniref:Aminoglycoside phosphotransferase domain-containing protein n=1 Tax=Roridomyces roridus TaxID=1738132 RepID=A0AAD7B370_9AGAR|nr:hypothetical protein FB45DRAFT_945660 [Roridomyces roridus]
MTTDYNFLPNPNLPSRETIVAQVKEVWKQAALKYTPAGFPLRDGESGTIIAWVKYGFYVTIHEAQTQDFVAKELARDRSSVVQVPRVFDAFGWQHTGYIVMEYVEGDDWKRRARDVNDVARAVERLMAIRGPDLTPGHIGAGYLDTLTFFWIAGPPTHYRSVEDLQTQINIILAFKNDIRRVDIVSESKDGLFLCPCKIEPQQFRRRASDGQLFALDFRMACFLPPSFFAAATLMIMTDFYIRVVSKLTYNWPTDANAITAASFHFIHYGPPPVPLGLPKHLKARPKSSPSSGSTRSSSSLSVQRPPRSFLSTITGTTPSVGADS